MRIGAILDWVNPVIGETFGVLAERGVELDLLRPEERMVDLAELRVENDLYILKSGTELALSVAGALHALGAATQMRNKIIVQSSPWFRRANAARQPRTAQLAFKYCF